MKILVDGAFFQRYRTGIARVWHSLLQEWAKSDFSEYIIVLDRMGTSPKIPGINYVTIPAYDYNNTEFDHQMLQQVCDAEGADLFISTYYTTPISTPSVFMAYDMIPEILGADFSEPMWQEKHRGIAHASAYICISENTAKDLIKIFPHVSPDVVTVAHCGISSNFIPPTTAEIEDFKLKYGINKSYFLLVGPGGTYKNSILFFKAFTQLPSRQGFDLICTGSGLLGDVDFRPYTRGSTVHCLQIPDEDLRIAYGGAVALIYPSKYEGFGMPIAEALACGCPVITCSNASIPEVGGNAVIYIKDDDVEEMIEALCEVQKPKVRRELITKGLQQSRKFSWSKMADIVRSALINATLIPLNLREKNLVIFPDWNQSEEAIFFELVTLIKTLITHPDSHQITLLIDYTNIADEDVNLMLSSIMMSVLMEEGLDELNDSIEIALVGHLNSLQWSALIPKIYGRIKLKYDHESALSKLANYSISTYQIQDLSSPF